MPRELRERRIERRRRLSERTRRPVHVLVTLLIEPSVRRHAADAALGLQAAERKGERRREPFLLAFLAEATRRLAGRFADAVGVERALVERLHDGVAQLVDLLLRDAELHGLLHVAVELAAHGE